MTIEYNEENLRACNIGALMQDDDGDSWVKTPEGTWSRLDSDGNPSPIRHSAKFLVECGPLAFLGTSERLQTYFANQGVQKAAEAVTEAPVADVNHIFDTAPKHLHELVKEGRYYISASRSGLSELELVYGCEECSEYDYEGGNLDLVDLLKGIDEHEKEHHSADRA